MLKEREASRASPALYEELKLHVKSTMGPWKYPRWIEFVDSLPKTATGKIQRYLLRSMATRSPARRTTRTIQRSRATTAWRR